jgi:hypothetical protein
LILAIAQRLPIWIHQNVVHLKIIINYSIGVHVIFGALYGIGVGGTSGILYIKFDIKVAKEDILFFSAFTLSEIAAFQTAK